jgi:AraC family L-rhamnose operon transcriptional activator RhaR
VHRLQLNRHLPEARWIEPHAHAEAQLLLYLAGTGSQGIAGRRYRVKSGTLFYIPARRTHAFREAAQRPALCLVLDCAGTALPGRQVLQASMRPAELALVQRTLAELSALSRLPAARLPLRQGMLILNIVENLLRALRWLPAAAPRRESSLVQRVRTILRAPSERSPSLQEVARAAGLQEDYLNRRIKEETGLTLRQWRDEVRLQRAQQALRQPGPVQAAAWAAGFDDPNYFARWFRQQTGQTPRLWKMTPA